MRNLRKQDDHDYWNQCKPGTILSVSDCKFVRDRRRFLVSSAMGATVVATGVFSAFFTWSHRKRTAVADNEVNEPTLEFVHPIDKNVVVRAACDDIANRLNEYVVAYRLESNMRSQEQAGLIVDFETHLSRCKDCSALVSEALRTA